MTVSTTALVRSARVVLRRWDSRQQMLQGNNAERLRQPPEACTTLVLPVVNRGC